MPTSHHPYITQSHRSPYSSGDEQHSRKGRKGKSSTDTSQSEQSDMSNRSDTKDQQQRRSRPSKSKDKGQSKKTHVVINYQQSSADSSPRFLSPVQTTKTASYDDRQQRSKSSLSQVKRSHTLYSSSHQHHCSESLPLHHSIYETAVEGRTQMTHLNERLVGYLKHFSCGAGYELETFKKLIRTLQMDMERMSKETTTEISVYQLVHYQHIKTQ